MGAHRLGIACLALVSLAACSRGPTLRENTGRGVARPATRANDLAWVGENLYKLESEGARLAFGDSVGEGDEDLEHTVFQSSIVILRHAVARDSTNGRAWLWLGEALTSRAYRGFGEWDSTDVAAAVAALGQAKRHLPASDSLSAHADSSLRQESQTLEALRRRR